MASTCNLRAIIHAFLALLLSFASAGFSPLSRTNLAVYWGTNNSQQRLSAYCSSDLEMSTRAAWTYPACQVITISFLTQIVNPMVNFANAGDNCTVFPGTTLLSCPQIEEDIQLCQSSYQKTIMLSIGGATYTEGGFGSPAGAVAAANNVWAMFGPQQAGNTIRRPFGKAIVDGFDFDFEVTTQNIQPFALELRGLVNATAATGGKPYYLSAAPQCPYPDIADDAMLNGGVSFDFIQIQFYNNYCGVSNFVVGAASQPSYNFDTWDNWASTGSANSDAKILVGIPANIGAGAGYTSGNILQAALAYSRDFPSFGGVMMWDMSQLYQNPGFQEEVVQYLGSTPTPTPPTTTASTSTASPSTASTGTAPTTTSATLTTTTSYPPPPPPSTSTASPTTTPPGTGVPEWGQCGGLGYTGPTNCASPLSCLCLSTWWCHCVNSPASTMRTVVARSTTDLIATSSTSTTRTATETGKPIPEWGQCGGIGYTGSTQCISPLFCACNSQWWCQCQSRPGSGDSSTPIEDPSENVVAQWGQCGGVGYEGSTTCTSPYSCACNSDWWCQCQ
ncbi:hypothetical protein KVR01_001690 [Diaporthe batatas]|uniref:uncharacterized protein n=1 Tax=Diaporthe batatas TaxID=748121 RepID=UPI001D04889D|nr:uncharacterized protein KVR01_001690 [Diaporthe batatas]KAG8168941.1 hypothetical protein KVR01_001690 [Diaporthe batatas]